MAERPANRSMGRRRFLLVAWGVTMTALFGETGAALLRMAQPKEGAGGFGGIIRAGRVDEFELNTVSYVRAGRFYLARTEDGFLALWQTCTHLGCSVPWQEEAGQFQCPCHASIFSLTGEVVGGPAPRPLDIFPIQVIEGEIFVDTGKPIQRNHYDPIQATRA